MRVGLIDHGVCNVDSIHRALEVCGAMVKRVRSPEELSGVGRIVLPGVGAFDVAMATLNAMGLTTAIRSAVEDEGKPLLGICLGMQLLLTDSEEGGQEPGFNLIPGNVRKIEPGEGEKVPHVGWNEIRLLRGSSLVPETLDGRDFYFVHSYCAHVADSEHVVAVTPFGGGIQSIINKGHIYGTQFHPEKSQRHGLSLLEKFVSDL